MTRDFEIPVASGAKPPRYDVAIVGASLAGCTAAILLARAGARVALVEKRTDPMAFKRLCTHFIQSSAVSTLERLGLLEAMEAAGAVRMRLRIRTAWGWIEAPADSSLTKCVNLRRELLDPMLRRQAAGIAGVELFSGWSVCDLWREGERVCGLEALSTSGERQRLRAQLVVGADGRDSRVAKLAGARAHASENARFTYGAYFAGPSPVGAPDGVAWALDPDWGLAAPTDGGLTFYAAFPTKRRHLSAFRHDPAGALVDYMAALPEAPPIRASRMVGSVLGKLDLTNVTRDSTGPGVALVGDAALTSDPLWAVGCGWALQSSEWLADSVAPALLGAEPLARGLERYRRRHSRALHPHARVIDAYARGERFKRPERLLLSAAARDEHVARAFEALATRNISPGRMLAMALPRAAALGARRSIAARLEVGPVRGESAGV